MIKETFIESVQDIVVSPGIIKIELAALSTSEKDKDDNPILEVNHRFLMTPYDFLNLFNTLQDSAQRLAETGIIKTDTEGEDNAESKATVENSSPNL